MNSEDFEKSLQQQQFRQVPPTWKSEVLSNARLSAGTPSYVSVSRVIIAVLRSQPSMIFWPSPKAWLSLAAIWMLLFFANTSLNETHATTASTASLPERERMLVWKQQEQLLNELLGPEETHVADRPRPAAPSPRSERQNGFLII